MEEILLHGLQARHTKLLNSIQEAKTQLSMAETRGISREVLSQMQIELRSQLASFTLALSNCLEKLLNPDVQVFKRYQDDQLTAEDLVTKMEILAKLNPEISDMSHHTRLPKLELGKFNGNILNWTAFWDRFEASVGSKSIADVDKLSYLIGSLEGSALQAVEGLESTNINYSIAVDILKGRFGKPTRVVDAHNEALQKLDKAHNTATDCRRTLNAIERHLRILEALGEKIDASQLRVTLNNKFPENVIYQVTLMTADDSSIIAIRKALDTVISALELSEINNSQALPLPNNTQSAPPVASTSTLHVSAENKRPLHKRKWQPKDEHREKGHSNRKRAKITCTFCSSLDHYSEDCDKYKSYKERRDKLRDRCFICFRSGHRAFKCIRKKKCVHCSKMHNRALCPKKTRSGETGLQCNSSQTVNMYNIPYHLLQTAVVQVRTETRSLTSRLLLDSGSQRTYMTTRLATKLQLKPDGEDLLMIYTFGSNKAREMTSPSAEVTILTKRGIERKIRVNIVPHITDRVPIADFSSPDVDIVADDSSAGEAIDLLIGNDLYFSFIRSNILKQGETAYLVDSDFGWLISGSTVDSVKENVLTVVTYCQCHDASCPYFTEPDLPLRDIDIKFLWALESIGITDSPKTSCEEEAVQFFNETVEYSQGRYQVKWPWVQYPPELPSNYGLAYGRLRSLLRRSDEQVLKEYSQILKEQLDSNIIEIVEPAPLNQIDHPVHYLPHHMVKQGEKRGRIVYDASAKIKNQKSLNECLYRGPSLLEDLTGLILKFRTGRVGVTADVEKAFLQVGLQEQDRDVTRFLWVKDPAKDLTDDNLVQYRFCRVPFGVISSPFLLTATIRYHITKNKKSLLTTIADRCYVDNLVTSVDTQNEAIELYHETTGVFKDLGMNIRDWMSNNKEFMNKIPKQQRAPQKDQMKVLGLMWNVNNDMLQLNVRSQMFGNETLERGITKKGVLRVLARIYDPCGFASPLVLPGKIFFQEICNQKFKWDEVLPENMLQQWKNIVANLEAIKDTKVQRHLANDITEDNVKYELHGFTDASLNAYAAVVYLRVLGKDKISTAFIMSKSRVTPSEDKSDLKIPRLELLGYLIGSRLIKYIKTHLDMTISKFYLWTDSQVVLAWMRSGKLLPPFVSRRVNEIKQTKDTLGLELCYVQTKENPADIATRPELWHMKQGLWLHGPKFLVQDMKTWPKQRKLNEEENCLAVRALDIVDGPEMSMKGYENQETDVYNTMDQEMPITSQREEICTNDSDINITDIKNLQKMYFPNEVSGAVTTLSKNLGLFLDDGILRSKGRMANANWPYNKRYPILIPKESPFTTSLIQKTHEKNLHVGVPHTLSIIRDKYWIPQGRAQVKKVLKMCPQCIKHGGGPYKIPSAPALPSERVNYSPPFTYTGLDYLGPVLVDTKAGREKRWICLLTCLAIRAVHLELLNDLTAEECLLALRRFTAARGIPKLIISDNAQQFKLTSEVLNHSYCTENNIRWKFIAQLAPWQGGFYERLVALVKHCLKRTLDKHLLSDRQMHTVVKEIESVLNTRPLTVVGSDLEEVLRPADFLTLGKCLEIDSHFHNCILQGTSTKIDLIEGWKRGQMILEEYKKMFVNQYLPSLRERFHHSHKQPRVKSTRTPKVGDIVQIKDDSKNRTNWKVGKIAALIKGRDGECRIAKVMVGTTEFTRSLGHLYPLEADSIDCGLEIGQTSDEARLETRMDVSNMPNSLQMDQVRITEIPTEPVDSMEVTTEEASESIAVEVHPEQVPPEVTESPIEAISVPNPPVSNLIELEPVSPGQIDEVDETNTPARSTTEVECGKRSAAIRAREKIAEWTRQLFTLL